MACRQNFKFAGAVINENGGGQDEKSGSSIFGGKKKLVNNGPKMS